MIVAPPASRAEPKSCFDIREVVGGPDKPGNDARVYYRYDACIYDDVSGRFRHFACLDLAAGGFAAFVEFREAALGVWVNLVFGLAGAFL